MTGCQLRLFLSPACWYKKIPKANRSPKSVSSQRVPEGKTELSVVSYNVWFDHLMQQERMIAIGKLIQEISPDLIALQEVTPQINYYLLSQEWYVG